VVENTEKKLKTPTQENQRVRMTHQGGPLGTQYEVKKGQDKLFERFSKIADSKQTTTAQSVCLDVSTTERTEITLEEGENLRVSSGEEDKVLEKLFVGRTDRTQRISCLGDGRHIADEV
jgi:hypothetical protein